MAGLYLGYSVLSLLSEAPIALTFRWRPAIFLPAYTFPMPGLFQDAPVMACRVIYQRRRVYGVHFLL
jgi:hypothetical protein